MWRRWGRMWPVWFFFFKLNPSLNKFVLPTSKKKKKKRTSPQKKILDPLQKQIGKPKKIYPIKTKLVLLMLRHVRADYNFTWEELWVTFELWLTFELFVTFELRVTLNYGWLLNYVWLLIMSDFWIMCDFWIGFFSMWNCMCFNMQLDLFQR